MRENTLKTIWARGEAVVNGWLSIPSSFSAEVMAHQGFDSLTVDMTVEQKGTLAALAETGDGRVFTLREFAGDAGDIHDPFGQDENRYRACRDEIKRCLERSIDRLLLHLDGRLDETPT